MKIKKEYGILFLVIALLFTYLLIQKREKVYYELPELGKIEGDLSRVVVRKSGSEMTLLREKDRWIILPENYPADKEMVRSMAEGISDLTLTVLVSESGNYALYELDEDKKINIEAYRGDEIFRKFEIGKTAASRRHTFVKLADDHRVYHARGSLANIFDKTREDLRDKNVMIFDDEIAEVRLTEGSSELVLVRSSIPVSVDLSQQGEEEAGDAIPEEEKTPAAKWVTDTGEPAKESDIEEMIAALSSLRCDGFVEGRTKEDLESPLYTVSLKGLKEYTVSFFEKIDTKYLATSSESDYVFLIPEWKARKIMKELEGLKETEE